MDEAWHNLALHFKTALLGGGILLAVALAIGFARITFDASRAALSGNNEEAETNDKEALLWTFVALGVLACFASAVMPGSDEQVNLVRVSGVVFAVAIGVPMTIYRCLRWLERIAKRTTRREP